jgi:cell volume regulation protein A
LVTRGSEVIIPTGSTRLVGWDQVTVLARVVDDDTVRKAFLSPFEDEEDTPPMTGGNHVHPG